jgi:hypothetical protein
MKRFAAIVLILLPLLLLGGCISQPATPPLSLPGSPETSPAPTTLPVETTPTEKPSESLGGPVQFIPGGEYHVGDRIRMTGTTILSPGNQLLIEVSSLAFSPTNKTTENQFSGASAIVTVEKGEADSQNRWSYVLDTAGFVPGDYQVLITGIDVPAFQKSAYFTLLP